jgi:hypothetical protein
MRRAPAGTARSYPPVPPRMPPPWNFRGLRSMFQPGRVTCCGYERIGASWLACSAWLLGSIPAMIRLKEIRYEKSLVYRRLGSGCLVANPSDYESLIVAAHVSLGPGACRHAGDEREVSVGVTEASIIQHPPVVSTGRRRLVGVRGVSCDQCLKVGRVGARKVDSEELTDFAEARCAEHASGAADQVLVEVGVLVARSISAPREEEPTASQ